MPQLKEHYVNLITDRETKEKYLDEVSNIMLAAYQNIGGPTHDMQDYLDDKYFWKLVRKNNKIIAALIYKLDDNTRKYNLLGTDGTKEGKSALFKILEDDIAFFDRGAYGEISDAVEHIYLNKLGGKPLSNKLARYILKTKFNKEVFELDPDGIHYTRMINGKPKRKVMVGNIPASYADLDADSIN